MTQNSEAAAHVSECISSPDNYNASSNIIFDFLAKKSKTYTDDFIQALTEVFNDPDVPPRSKFYALYLLAKSTETGNELLMTRLAKQKELLNKFFKDCQFTDAKSVTEKGKTFFSQAPTPEESILGGNYVRLLLECFSYWNKTFGTDDDTNPLHIYHIMYNTLAERIRLPENFLYITRTFEINEDFHYAPPASLSNLHMMRSSSGSPSKIFSPNASLGNLGTIRGNSSMPSSPALVESIREQVKSCLSSGRNYKRNNYKVFDGISSQNAKKYIAEYLELTKEFIAAKESTPSQKFYAVYLLLRASETNNKALITELVTTRKDLLSDLYASASFDYKNESRERGRNIFSKEPSEDEGRVGKNFIILTTETLVFWRRTFFVGAKDPTSVFDLINSKLEAKRLIPREFYYVGKTLDTDGENYATRFEALAPQNFPKSDLKSPGTSPARASKEQFFNSPEEKPRSSSQSPDLREKEKPSPSKPTPKEENFAAVESIKNPIKVKSSSEKQSPELVQVQEGLTQLEHKKTALRQFLENNKQENDMKDFVDYLSQDVSNTYEKNVLPQVDPLIANGSPSSEKYVTRIFTEGEVVENLKGYNSKYKKGQIQYKDFRSKVVPLLRSRDEPAPTTTEPVVAAVVTETSEVFKTQETYQREPREKIKKSAAPPEMTLNKPVPQLENIEPIRTDAGLGKPPRSLLSPTAEQSNSIIASKNHQKQKSADVFEDPNKSTKLTKPIQHLISPVRREEGDTFDGSLKNSSTWKLYSLRTTPGRNGVLEGEDTRQSLKLSRVRSTDLSVIENSIRHSFVSSGRKPPQFKPLDELQVKEEFEKEINKLRLEKDAQQKEITRLNSELKQVGNQTQNLKEIDQLRQTVSQQKQKIDSLENEVRALTQQNIELSKLQDRIRELELSQKPGHENDLPESKKVMNLTLNQSGGHHQRGRSIDSQSRKLGTGPIEEDEDEEKYETPTNEYSVSQTRYDANWANTQPGASVESSMYDVEWPATAQQGTNLAAQLETKQSQNTMIRGQEIQGTHQMYSDIIDRIQGSHELKTFKLANLKTKCPLYENDQIRVGISTAIVHDVSSHKNMLKMVLYYENKSNQFISSFVAEVVQGKNTNRFAKPNPLECSLEQGKQIKQQVVVTFEKVPFEALRLLLSVNGNPYEIYLPTLISKFAEFKLIETEAFLEKWKTQSQNVLKTEELVIDTSIVKTAYDFKKFFPYLADLNPMNEYEYLQGTKSIKLGGIFEIDGPHQEYLLKINILPTQKVVFQIAVSESESNLASFFLQSLAFLFKKP